MENVSLDVDVDKLLMFLDTHIDNTPKIHRALCLLISLIGNKKKHLWWASIMSNIGIHREFDGYDNIEMYTEYSDIIPPQRTSFSYNYKEEELKVMLSIYSSDNERTFEIALNGAMGSNIKNRCLYIPSKREFVQHLEDIIDNQILYNRVQCSTKNMFVEYCKKHKLNTTMNNFDSILSLTYSTFELYDLNVVKDCYIELYNKSEDDGIKYIEENKNLLTNFYGFSDYESFNKLISDLKSKILKYDE